MDQLTLSSLHANETLHVAEGIPHIVYYREGSEACPLAVFLPGGGHLGRVSYGHPGAERRDFIDAWLSEAGYGLLALSYPSDHSAFAERWTDLSIVDWASSVAELIRAHVREKPSRELILLGWSLAGRAVVAIERALRQRGLGQLCFVSLAATAPLPNLLPARSTPERFTSEGFWDSATRHAQWLAQVKKQIGVSGGAAIDETSYLEHYVVNSPFTLRAQLREPEISGEPSSPLCDEIGAFDYRNYPCIAAIIPTGMEDPLHALTDAAVWGALNVLRLAHDPATVDCVSATSWEAFQDLLRQIPQRLCRTIRGGHFFFIGESGAMTTVSQVIELTREVRTLRQELRALCGRECSPS